MEEKGKRLGKGPISEESSPPRLEAACLPEVVVDFLIEKGSSGSRGIRTLALEGDASDRSYFRLILEGSGEGERDSYVIMKLDRPWAPEGGQEELPFVNIARHLSEKGIPVPRVFVDASEEGFVLLEDVGRVTLERHLEKKPSRERRRRYEFAIEMLVRMQSEVSRVSNRPCYALTYAFDPETFFQELCFFREHALEGLWGHSISTDDRTELEEHFRRLCEEINEYPQVFTHRDYHSRNLMVQADRLVVLDFQDARLGPITYDLASLLRDSYVCLSMEEQAALIATYRELAQRVELACLDTETFQRAFSRTGLQRNLKAIGTFAYQAVVKGVDRYLPSIPNTVNSTRLAFESDPGLAAFKQILKNYVEGL
jgi:aminoglycoside/choline kinase family phosphotransferase